MLMHLVVRRLVLQAEAETFIGSQRRRADEIAEAIDVVKPTVGIEHAVGFDEGPDAKRILRADKFELRAVGLEQAASVTEIETRLCIDMIDDRAKAFDERVLVACRYWRDVVVAHGGPFGL